MIREKKFLLIAAVAPFVFGAIVLISGCATQSFSRNANAMLQDCEPTKIEVAYKRKDIRAECKSGALFDVARQ